MPLLMPIPWVESQYAANSASKAAKFGPSVKRGAGRPASNAARYSSAMAVCQRVTSSAGTIGGATAAIQSVTILGLRLRFQRGLQTSDLQHTPRPSFRSITVTVGSGTLGYAAQKHGVRLCSASTARRSPGRPQSATRVVPSRCQRRVVTPAPKTQAPFRTMPATVLRLQGPGLVRLELDRRCPRPAADASDVPTMLMVPRVRSVRLAIPWWNASQGPRRDAATAIPTPKTTSPARSPGRRRRTAQPTKRSRASRDGSRARGILTPSVGQPSAQRRLPEDSRCSRRCSGAWWRLRR